MGVNLLSQFEQKQIEKLNNNKIGVFESGDTVKVNVRIIEGTNERIQAYEGIVIAKSNKGLSSSFIVLKISNGVGVKRLFMRYSPKIHSVEVIRRGIVRRAKLYYLESRRQKGIISKLILRSRDI